MSHPRNAAIALPADLRARLRRLIAERGEVAAAAALLVGRSTLARALANLKLRRGSALAIAMAIESLDGIEPHEPEGA